MTMFLNSKNYRSQAVFTRSFFWNSCRNVTIDKVRSCRSSLYCIKTSDSSLKNSWAAYGPGNSNHLEISLTDSKDHCKKCMVLCSGVVKCVCVRVCVSSFSIQ